MTQFSCVGATVNSTTAVFYPFISHLSIHTYCEELGVRLYLIYIKLIHSDHLYVRIVDDLK